MNLTLIKKVHETKDIVTFLFQQHKQFTWKPGQYLRYILPHPNPDNRGYKRYFTISTAPYEKSIGLTTRFAKEKGSSFKKALYSLKVGDIIQAESLQGEFMVDDPIKKYVFIAGGVGITPYRAILLDLAYHKEKPNVTLLYANKTNDFAFKDTLENLTKTHTNFKIHYIVNPQRISEQKVRAIIHAKPIFYVSGPASMVFAIEEMLKKLHIKDEYIKLDDFPGYNDI